MAHTLPALPYAFNALEPHIDAATMEIHSQKHHKAYVDNLNKALENHPDLLNLDIVSLLKGIKNVPEAIRQPVINNGGGHHNHSLFWEIMTPNGGGEPTGEIGDAIKAAFGDFAAFKTAVKTNATGQFGSGWSWLVYNPTAAKIEAVKKPNQDSPLMDGNVPLLGIDVWEHAYYLKYQNKRPDYVDAWWNTVNWKKVNELYANAKAGK
ncbi:superoxide dismutase [Limnoglobus roseus]|uniref:Superoxide dismutase n=1 Tax=Limnoglobus roseus TaxID=2598579 RepID=A0A5C1A8W2_9BACT|nr:superoxide dismutase [Limnoglobus roseus]QEL14965.1 superoxide dismutase [Limnoglobus roseus]